MTPIDRGEAPTPQEAPVETMTGRRRPVIGLPKCSNASSTAFFAASEGLVVEALSR